MTSEREKFAEEYAAQALQFLAQSDAEFDAGDDRQGAEKLYGAATQAVIAASKQRGWGYRSHRANKNAATRLAAQYDDNITVCRISGRGKVSHSLPPWGHGGLEYRGEPPHHTRLCPTHG